MGTNYVLNLVGVKLPDEKMADVPYPRFELLTHITFKTIQAGTLLGCLFIAPAYRAARGPRTMSAIYQSAVNGGRNGAIIGTGLGPVLTYMRMRGVEDMEPYYDRSYRLRYNRGQVRVDRLSILGSLGGAGVAMFVGAPAVAGAVFGMSGGILLSAFYTNAIAGDEKHKKKKKEEEKVEEKTTGETAAKSD